MDAFNKWLQQFIKSKGRGSSKKNFGKKFICVTGVNKPLFLDTSEFNEWLERKREAFAGLEHLKKENEK